MTPQRMRPIILEDDTWSEPSMAVCCPRCGSSYQHHADTVVFARDEGEDGPTTVLAIGGPVDPFLTEVENPSPRRNAVRIHFDGECGHLWYLDVVQHKGETYLFTSFVGDADDNQT